MTFSSSYLTNILYAEEVFTINLESNVFSYMPRNGDTMKSTHLKIPISVNLDNIESISISNAWNVPFSLMRKLVTITEYESYYYVPFHENLLLCTSNEVLKEYDDNYLIRVGFDDTGYITLKSNMNFNYQILAIYRYYKTEQRKQLVYTPHHKYMMNDYHTDIITNGESQLTSTSVSTGLFIETENEPLKNIEMTVNGYTLFKYNAHAKYMRIIFEWLHSIQI